MEFKDRFKGRTTLIKKQGVIDSLVSSNNPLKSTSNPQLPVFSKVAAAVVNNFESNNTPNLKHLSHHSVENRSGIAPHVPHSYSKSPLGHSHSNQVPQKASANIPTTKNPYLVSNPFPSMDMVESQNLQGVGAGYNQMAYRSQNQQNIQQPSIPLNEFNPNNFYNQHSQFRSVSDKPVSKENAENQNSVPITTNQIVKKSFENLIQQNKQKRMAGEALRSLDNQLPQQVLSNQFEGYGKGFQNYSNMNDKSALAARELHSNPSSSQKLGGNVIEDRLIQQSQPARQNESQNQLDPSQKSGYSSKTSYKPYNLRDYKDLNSAPIRLGGLGPNLNTDEWQKEKEKRDKMVEFSQNVKVFNSQRVRSDNNSKLKQEKEREKSSREIALEFAKNIPKPKPRRNSSPDEDSPIPSDEKYVKEVNSRPHSDLDDLEQRHRQYAAQLERLKLS